MRGYMSDAYERRQAFMDIADVVSKIRDVVMNGNPRLGAPQARIAAYDEILKWLVEKMDGK